MALTGEILAAVAARRCGPTIRVFEPGPTLAFGRQDTLLGGFQRARGVASELGFTPVVRHAGGRAIAYGTGSLIVELIRPEDSGFKSPEARFRELAALLVGSLGQLGMELELEEVPREYCPGRFSLRLPGGPKVAGIAQRVVRGASLTTSAITVAAGDKVRRVTADVYQALGLPLDIGTVGSLTDRFADANVPAVAQAVSASALALAERR